MAQRALLALRGKGGQGDWRRGPGWGAGGPPAVETERLSVTARHGGARSPGAGSLPRYRALHGAAGRFTRFFPAETLLLPLDRKSVV